MLDLSKIPHERWALDIQAEAKHPRMQEFKDSLREHYGYTFRFCSKFYGKLNFKDKFHVADFLPKGVTLLTLDQVIEYCEPKTEPVNSLRFKTEDEFIQEFGEDWRGLAYWPVAMNYLFGLPCRPEWVGNRQDMHSDKTNGDSAWRVYPDMVTDKPLPEAKSAPAPFDNFEATGKVLSDINTERESYVQLLILAAKADRNDLVQFILNKIV